MEHTALFEISRCFDTVIQLYPLAFEDIYLEVMVDVVNQEAHMLSQLKRQSENRLLV